MPSSLALLSLAFLLLSSAGALPRSIWRDRAAVETATPPPSSYNLSAQPYRTAFHFQPFKNWMNDPNGPLFYKGYYHLFYQYNPYGAVWGNIIWGHAVSKDLIHWQYLKEALVPDHWYDINGCWSGSATFLPDGRPAILYTGWSNSSTQMQVQMQNMAVPEDPTDPLLLNWVKVPQNPIIVAPEGINSTKFRDPTTGWYGSDGKWRILIGSVKEKEGMALLYKSSDFIKWEKVDHPLHSVPKTGMWECPDFYPVSAKGKQYGVDTSINGPYVKHVLKVSLDDTRHDHYAVGTYDEASDTFKPITPTMDAGIGLRYDYGKFYASKTFYDLKTGRRILLGWINESDSSAADVKKGWASVQAIPRVIWLDNRTGNSLLQLPVEELKSLRGKKTHISKVTLEAGSVMEVKKATGAEFEVEVSFEVPDLDESKLKMDMDLSIDEMDSELLCNQKGRIEKSVGGPFGLYVLASHDLRERTAISFHLFYTSKHGGWKALVCSDQSRSSLGLQLDLVNYGAFVSLFQKDKLLSLRVLVDHSIVETFAQGGEVCITSRVYPTLAINEEAHLYVYNDGNQTITVKSLKAWAMASARLTNFS